MVESPAAGSNRVIAGDHQLCVVQRRWHCGRFMAFETDPARVRTTLGSPKLEALDLSAAHWVSVSRRNRQHYDECCMSHTVSLVVNRLNINGPV
jgi:hypothetical protein